MTYRISATSGIAALAVIGLAAVTACSSSSSSSPAASGTTGSAAASSSASGGSNPLSGGGSSGQVVIGSANFPENEVLAEVYAHLGQPFDPESVGSLTGELPSLDTGIVERALLADYRAAGATDPQPLDEPVLALARELVGQHRLPDPAGATGPGAITDPE